MIHKILVLLFVITATIYSQNETTIGANEKQESDSIAIDSDDSGLGVDRYIAMIASIAALVTSLLVLFSLLEMKRQRKSSYKPAIVIKGRTFYLANTKPEQLNPEWFKSEEDADLKLKDESHRSSYMTFELDSYNLGFGAAKSIKLNWSFQLEEIVDRVRKSCEQSDLEIEFQNEGKWLKLSRQGSFVLTDLESNLKSNIDYILPTSIYPNPTSISIPSTFLLLLSQVYKAAMDKSESTAIFNEKFKLTLELTYLDLESNELKEEYDVKFKLNMFSNKEISGYVEVRQLIRG